MIEPLTPPDCDLRDFQFMPLHVARLRDSDLAAFEEPEACWYAVLLWTASWHQMPAASLPDDDRVLAKLCGLGRDISTFQRVRDGALHGFVKCDDGRLYHPVVAEQANDAWAKKCSYRERREKRVGAAKKAATARWSPSDEQPDAMRDASQSHADRMPDASADDAKRMRNASEIDAERMRHASDDDAERMPDAMRDASQSQCRKGQGQGQGVIPLANANGRPAEIIDPAKMLFDTGIALIQSAGGTERHARSWLGKARRDHGDAAVIAAIGRAQRDTAIDPIPHMEGTLRRNPGQNSGEAVMPDFA